MSYLSNFKLPVTLSILFPFSGPITTAVIVPGGISVNPLSLTKVVGRF